MKNNKNIETLSSFISSMNQNSNNMKIACHYKNIKNMISFFNCMVAYKNITDSEKILIPNLNVENDKCVSMSFDKSENIDLPKLNECVKKYCPHLSVSQDVKTTTLVIKT